MKFIIILRLETISSVHKYRLHNAVLFTQAFERLKSFVPPLLIVRIHYAEFLIVSYVIFHLLTCFNVFMK